MKFFEYAEDFVLESGQILNGFTVAYHTYGELNDNRSNVVWVCHALTANSDVAAWWPGLVGNTAVLSPEDHFIVCANILGSCYGTTGPLTINPETGNPYYSRFPNISIRDMVRAHILLRKHLDIEQIFLLVGGSMGGYQAMEWSIMEREVIKNLFLLATSATESAWGIAVHTAQRLSIEADTTWKDDSPHAGKNGLKAARAIGMLTYRNYAIIVKTQSDPDFSKLDHFKAADYIIYQGNKLADRFNSYSYWLLTKSMDSHNLARERTKTVSAILNTITQPTLIIGILSDILCPVAEQQFIADHIPHSTLVVLDSSYGHDGFLVESPIISKHLEQWLNKTGS